MHLLKNCYMSLAYCLIVTTFNAQENFSSGGNAIGIEGTVNFSIGQVFYHHLNDDNFSIHEGVQYGFDISSSNESNDIKLSCLLFPNPTSSLLTLTVNNCNKNNLEYQLFNNNGQLLKKESITNLSTILNFSKHPKQSYIMTIISDGKIINSFTIIKK